MESKVQKQNNCKRCCYFDGIFCRVGLGWGLRTVIGYCDCFNRIEKNRCGTCHWFMMEGNNRLNGCCKLHNDFRNYYNRCAEYTTEEGKDLKPIPGGIPLFRIERVRKFLKERPDECKRRGITDIEKYLEQNAPGISG